MSRAIAKGQDESVAPDGILAGDVVAFSTSHVRQGKTVSNDRVSICEKTPRGGDDSLDIAAVTRPEDNVFQRFRATLGTTDASGLLQSVSR